MIFEKVDLYEYFGLRRKSNEKGILTVYARPLHGEEPQDKRRPAMLVLPGGGYKFVSAREGECVALEWLQRGYNAFAKSTLPALAFPQERIFAPCFPALQQIAM